MVVNFIVSFRYEFLVGLCLWGVKLADDRLRGRDEKESSIPLFYFRRGEYFILHLVHAHLYFFPFSASPDTLSERISPPPFYLRNTRMDFEPGGKRPQLIRK